MLTSFSIYSNVFNWIFPPLVQSRLDEFCTYWNNHRLCSQPNKHNPSGTSPRHMLEVPESVRPGARHCGIRVRKELVDQLRESIGGREGRDWAFSFVTPEFQMWAESARGPNDHSGHSLECLEGHGQPIAGSLLGIYCIDTLQFERIWIIVPHNLRTTVPGAVIAVTGGIDVQFQTIET